MVWDAGNCGCDYVLDVFCSGSMVEDILATSFDVVTRNMYLFRT
jgi:hypothetical protein